MTPADGTLALPAALLRWARLPGSAELLKQVRTKLERGARGDRVTVGSGLSVGHRSDVGRLLGRRWEVSGSPVTLGKLRAAIADASRDLDTTPTTLETLLRSTSGPLRDLPAERRQAAQRRSSHRTQITDLLEGAGVPAPVGALAVQRRWLGDGAESVDLATLVARLLTQRANGGTQLLAEAGTQLCGDPHALDRDRPLGRAVVRVLAAGQALAAGLDPTDLASASDGALAAARWREVWKTAGVVCDRVSSTVLVLNLPLTGDAPAAALLPAVVGEPVWLTARALSGTWAPSPALRVARVCENPTIAEAAADQLGPDCPPLVCTYGRPSTAAHTLLRRLHAAGVHLLVSADRDTAGHQITDELLRAYTGAEPWRPDLAGLYEEERLPGLLADLAADLGKGA